ncbi:MAG: hypothetical protein RLZZ502_1509 [Pseudomonadota bacterium]
MAKWFVAMYRCRNCRNKFKKTRKRAYLIVVALVGLFAFSAYQLRQFIMDDKPRLLESKGNFSSSGEASDELKKKARLGDVESQFKLGYSLRQSGRLEDDKQAVDWFKKASVRGHQDASFYLGMHYAEGRGVLQDYPEAMHIIGKLADANHANAQNMVGNFYRRGLGMPINKAKAYVWYNIAAAKGHRDAMSFRDIMGSQLTGTDLAEAQKLARSLDAQLQRGEGSGELSLQNASKLLNGETGSGVNSGNSNATAATAELVPSPKPKASEDPTPKK